MNDVQTTVKAYILSEFLPDANPDELTADTPLVTGGILDSLATVRLVVFIEEHFGIEVHAHEVNADNLDSLAQIAAFVAQRLPEDGATPAAAG